MQSRNEEQPTIGDVYKVVWRLDGRLDGVDNRINRLEANTEFIRSSHEENGKMISAINERCIARKRQISDLYNRVGMAFENTGQYKLSEAQRETRWRTIKIIAAATVTAIGLAIAIIQLITK